MAAKKKRLDLLLMEKKLVSSRNRARTEIMAGNVYVDGRKEEKPGSAFPPEARVELRGSASPFVSRGGLKLEKALQEFAIDLKGKVVLDVGASTGGFTHCALKHGARKVYALDVGYGQLAWEIRNHPQVVVMERFNVRHLKKEDLPEKPCVATIDVSFISLKLVLPVLASISVAEIICLVKPQFETSPGQVGKKGVVRDAGVHEQVLRRVLGFALQLSYRLKGLTFSPLKGPRGNLEYLLYLGDKGRGEKIAADCYYYLVRTVVLQAHQLLR